MPDLRLCIDGRAASATKARELAAHEALSALLAHEAESDGESGWLVDHAPLVVSHPEHALRGPWPRFETRVRVRRSPLHWAWEKKLFHDKRVTAYHRFRPIDRLSPYPNCPTITTVLPPVSGLPFFLSRRPNQTYVVPSRADAARLERGFHVDSAQVRVHLPRVRGWTKGVERPRISSEGVLLFLLGGRGDLPERKRLMTLITSAYPQFARRVVSLESQDFREEPWLKTLQGVRVCFYLTALPFDWPTLALETLQWGIPTIFSDRHASLSELLPQSPFKLSQFLVDSPELPQLETSAREARAQLESRGVLDPTSLAEEYRALYGSRFPSIPKKDGGDES